MALMVAAKHPELFAGVSIWAAMTNLRDWHQEMMLRTFKDYTHQLEVAFGGLPSEKPSTYWLRSPVSKTDRLKDTPIDLNAGITDGHHGTVAISHSLNFFNAICAKHDRLSVDIARKLMEGKQEQFPSNEIVYRPPIDPIYGAKRVLFRRESENIRLTIFDGDHEMITDAAIDWLSHRSR